MDLGDITDDLSSAFKSADVITPQIDNRKCTTCEQVVNKYVIRVGQKVTGGLLSYPTLAVLHSILLGFFYLSAFNDLPRIAVRPQSMSVILFASFSVFIKIPFTVTRVSVRKD